MLLLAVSLCELPTRSGHTGTQQPTETTDGKPRGASEVITTENQWLTIVEEVRLSAVTTFKVRLAP